MVQKIDCETNRNAFSKLKLFYKNQKNYRPGFAIERSKFQSKSLTVTK